MKTAKQRNLGHAGGHDRFALFIPVEMYRDPEMPFKEGDLVDFEIMDIELEEGTFPALIIMKSPDQKKGKGKK